MKYVGYILGALVLIGVLKGLGDADLSQSASLVDKAGDIAAAVIDGVADLTIRLIPTVIDAVTSIANQLPDNGDYQPPTTP